MTTVVLAVGLTIIGLALIYLPADTAGDLIRALPIPTDIQTQVLGLIGERIIAHLCLAASPVLLIAGSLLPGL